MTWFIDILIAKGKVKGISQSERSRLLILELIERHTMTVQELPQRQRSRPPHLLLLREPLNTLLKLLLMKQLPLPALPRREGVLSPLPFDLLLLRGIGPQLFLLSQLVIPLKRL